VWGWQDCGDNASAVCGLQVTLLKPLSRGGWGVAGLGDKGFGGWQDWGDNAIAVCGLQVTSLKPLSRGVGGGQEGRGCLVPWRATGVAGDIAEATVKRGWGVAGLGGRGIGGWQDWGDNAGVVCVLLVTSLKPLSRGVWGWRNWGDNTSVVCRLLVTSLKPLSRGVGVCVWGGGGVGR
jgi:hypothetical protein